MDTKMNTRNQTILLKVNKKKIIIEMIKTLYYYQNTTHPTIATLWMNYIYSNGNHIHINKLIKEFISIIEKFKNYPDLSINQICLLIAFAKQ